MVIGLGISYGITPLIAQNSGRNDYAECGKLLSNSLFINISSGIVLFACLFFGSLYVINHLNQAPQVVQQAKPFLTLLGLSIIPMLIFTTFKQFAEGLGFTRQAMVISVIGNILNICLGIIFVKGLFGITPMGIRGVGYATLIDRSSMAVVMSMYVFKSRHFQQHIRSFAVKNIGHIRSIQILRIGAPIAMQYTFEISAFSAAAIMIGTISLVQQAAHQVAISLASMTYMVSSGIAAAATIKSGNYFGISDHKGLRLSSISSYHIVLVFMFSTAILFGFGNHLLPYIYTSDKAVIYFAAQLLTIAAVFQLFDGTQVVGLGVLRGMGDVNVPTMITFLAYWIIGIPVGYYFGVYLQLWCYRRLVWLNTRPRGISRLNVFAFSVYQQKTSA